MAKPNERRGGLRGRLVGLAVLIGLVALAMAYFGNCIPGFGVGGSPPSSSPSSQPPATQTEPSGDAADGEGVRIMVDGDRCRRMGATFERCDQLCAELAVGVKTERITIDGTLGTHAAVDGLRKCLTEHGFRDVVVRAE